VAEPMGAPGYMIGEEMKTKTLLPFHVLLWIGPPILWTVWLCLNPKLDYLSWGQWIYAGLLSVFGPYATLLGGLGYLPNAGGFFRTDWALGLTVPLMAVVILPYKVKAKWVHILCGVLYVPLIFLWVYIGVAQIGACIT